MRTPWESTTKGGLQLVLGTGFDTPEGRACSAWGTDAEGALAAEAADAGSDTSGMVAEGTGDGTAKAAAIPDGAGGMGVGTDCVEVNQRTPSSKAAPAPPAIQIVRRGASGGSAMGASRMTGAFGASPGGAGGLVGGGHGAGGGLGSKTPRPPVRLAADAIVPPLTVPVCR